MSGARDNIQAAERERVSRQVAARRKRAAQAAHEARERELMIAGEQHKLKAETATSTRREHTHAQ